MNNPTVAFFAGLAISAIICGAFIWMEQMCKTLVVLRIKDALPHLEKLLIQSEEHLALIRETQRDEYAMNEGSIYREEMKTRREAEDQRYFDTVKQANKAYDWLEGIVERHQEED